MGMRPIDLIAISGKTQDATLAQQTSIRAHGNQQDQLAVQQSARSERAAEQVASAPAEDRLELSTQGEGGAGGGSGAERGSDEAAEPSQAAPAEPESGHHIDFLA